MLVTQATIDNPRRSKRLPIVMRSLPSSCLLVASVVLGACTASSSEVAPHNDQFFFPTGAAIAPDGSVLFVANANSDLKYDSGSVQVVDLAIVDQVIAAWTGSGTFDADKCSRDPQHQETLICDETQFIRTSAGIRVGNFATDIAVQDTGNGTLRLIIPTRGDPSIAWADYNNDALSCSKSSETNALCDDTHRLSYVQNDPNLASLPEEPFMAYADSVGQYAIVSHLTTGAVTLIDSPIGGDAIVADVKPSVFSPDPTTGLFGSTGVAGKPNGASGSMVYVGSRSEDRVQMFTVGRPANNASPFLLEGNYFFLDGVGNNSGSSTDTRGMQFSSKGDRLYLVNRNPASLQVIDTSLDAGGFPKNQTVASTDICRQGSTLAVMDLPNQGERAYVTCFQDGQLYVVDPSGQGSVEDVIEVGRGPYAVVGARGKVYVTNFLEDTIAVVDVEPTSATHDRVVLRIGTVRPL